MLKGNPAVLILALALYVAGCVSPPTNEVEDEGWTHIDEGEALYLSLEDLKREDWLLIEVDQLETQIVGFIEGQWDFPGPAVSPFQSDACVLLSMGNVALDEQVTLHPPFIVPERLNSNAVELGPQPKLGLKKEDMGFHFRARSTGFGYGTDIMLFMTGPLNSSNYLAFGLADHKVWEANGGKLTLELGLEEKFRYREVYRGHMDCRIEFEDYNEGEFYRTSHYTEAYDLKARFSTSEGLVAYSSYLSDMDRSVNIANPSGKTVYENRTRGSTVSTPLSFGGEGFALCGHSTGEWTFSYPIIQGTDHRGVYADTLFLDVPPEYQNAFECTHRE